MPGKRSRLTPEELEQAVLFLRTNAKLKLRDIAARLHVGTQRVGDVLARHGLALGSGNNHPDRQRRPRHTGDAIDPNTIGRPDPLRIAQETLGTRFDRETMTIDGRWFHIDDVMAITNRQRKAAGLPQVVTKPEWRQ